MLKDVIPTPEQVARQRSATRAVWQADVATRPGGDWADFGGLEVFTTGLAPAHWNGAHLVDRDGLARLGEAADWFAERGVPWGLLAPAELAAVPPGFSPVTEQGVMLRDLVDLPPLPDVDLTWDVGVAGHTLVQAVAFDAEPALVTAFLAPKLLNAACGLVAARVDGEVVATATSVVVDGVLGGVVAVFGVGTLPGWRRRGLGAAVTLAVLHEARGRGADLAYLNPSELGHGMYASLGFVDAPPWQIWSPPG